MAAPRAAPVVEPVRAVRSAPTEFARSAPVAAPTSGSTTVLRSTGNRAAGASGGEAGADTASADTFTLSYTGDDPASVIAELPRVVRALAKITLDAEAVRLGVPTAVLRPSQVFVYTEDQIVVLGPDGAVRAVVAQDVMHSVMTDGPYVVLREHHTGRVWFVGTRGGNVAIQSLPRIGGVPDPKQAVGNSVLLAFLPGITMPKALLASLRQRAKGRSGTEAEAPDWAREAAAGLRRRRGRTGGTGDHGDGPGAGDKGTGRGGGGTDDKSTGTGAGAGTKTGTGTGTGTGTKDGTHPQDGTKDGSKDGTKDGTGPPGTPEHVEPPPAPVPAHAPESGRPLQGPVQYRAEVDRNGTPQLRITIDRASTVIGLHDGEAAATLDRRVAAAEEALQQSRDPAQHQRVADGATSTGFTPPARGATGAAVSPAAAQAQARAAGGAAQTPGERVPGAASTANAPAYPSTVTMAGLAPKTPAASVSGATNRFTMTMDYAARSMGFSDEVLNRMQTVQFYWELIDVSGLTTEGAAAVAARTKLGGGEAQGAYSGAGADLGRTARNVGADQEADLAMMREQNWPWEARSAYLAVIGLSNTVRLLGSVISSFIDVLTQPLNERSIGFDRDGDFLVRCVATPQSSDEALADPDHHVIRASSVAVLPVRIAPLGVRAAETADAESTSLESLRAALVEAEATGNPRLIATARARLEAAIARSHVGGFDLFEQTLRGLRREVEVAERLKARPANAPVSDLTDDEVMLQLVLLQSGESIDRVLFDAQNRLAAFGGKEGEHETWVKAEHKMFVPVGGVADFRPRIALASEENGQVTEVRTMLGELSGSVEGKRHWALVDITSPATRDTYDGRSSQPGAAGHAAAIRDAFRNFAETASYGRGTLAIRLPPELEAAVGGPVPVERQMESRPGPKGRALQRLSDLATVAEIAGLFATGGLGVAIGAVGGVAGAIVAADSLARRARTGHVMEIGTVFDALGLVGGLASVASVGTAIARDVAEAGRAVGKLPAWVERLEAVEGAVHLHARVGPAVQLILIPAQVLHEWAEIEHAEGLTPGERDARRARALLGALKSVTVTVISAGGGFGHEVDPATLPRAGAQEQGLPRGTGAHEANDLADGTGPARPPLTGGEPGPARPATEGAAPVGPSTEGPAPTERRTSPPAAEAESPARPSLEAQAAQARELAARRLREERAATAAREPVERPSGRETPAEPDDARRNADDEVRTAMGTPRGPAGPADANGDLNTPERTRVVDLLSARLGQERAADPAPGAPAIRGPGTYGGRRPRSADEAVALYDQAVAVARRQAAADSHGPEIGLFFNPNTGEFAVEVGTEMLVRAPDGDGWHALVHVHPNPENVVVRRLPAPADVANAVETAFRYGSHTEFVQSTRADGSTGLSRVTVTTHPVRIVVELPAAPGEPARRIEVDSPDAYVREYGSDTTYLDPDSPLAEWVRNDLDDYYRLRRRDADGPDPDESGPYTAMGTVRSAPHVPNEAEAAALTEITKLRARLYGWRAAAGGNPEAELLIRDHLEHLSELRKAALTGENVDGRLAGIRESLPAERRLLRPVDPDRVSALVRRARRMARRSRDDAATTELERIAAEAESLARRMAARPKHDTRVEFDTLRRQLLRASRQDYEVVIELGDPAQRAAMVSWFDEHLTPLRADPVGELLANAILRHLDAADVLTLGQSPRSAGTPVSNTEPMRQEVRNAVDARRYPPEYVAVFEAARGRDDGEPETAQKRWPRSEDGRVWQVDHVDELWLGGADNASNYLALPAAVHDLKTEILKTFRREFRSRAEPDEQVDLRGTDPPEPREVPEAGSTGGGDAGGT